MSLPRPVVVKNFEELREHLERLVELEREPLLVGMGKNDAPFAAVMREEENGEIFCEALFEDPYNKMPEWAHRRCSECGGLHLRYGIDEIFYPATILVGSYFKDGETT